MKKPNDSFGRRISVSGAPTETSFTGREWDEETGLYYYRARYYDPAIGRFTQEDPIWGSNLYAYVGNNPLNFLDSYGLKRYSWPDYLSVNVSAGGLVAFAPQFVLDKYGNFYVSPGVAYGRPAIAASYIAGTYSEDFPFTISWRSLGPCPAP